MPEACSNDSTTASSPALRTGILTRESFSASTDVIFPWAIWVPRRAIILPFPNSFVPWRLPVRDGKYREHATEQTAEDQPKNGPVNIVMGESRQNDSIREKQTSQTTNEDTAYEANGNGDKEIRPLIHGVLNPACRKARSSGTEVRRRRFGIRSSLWPWFPGTF